MKNDTTKKQEYFVIDFLHIIKSVWRRIWVVILCAIIAGVGGFVYSSFCITPMYSSSIMLYVNNSSIVNATLSFSVSDISAAQSLVKTYSVILEARDTLDEIIKKTGVEYTHAELCEMISASDVNETEVIRVTVTSDDAEEAYLIADCISNVLPDRIAKIISKSNMAVVDHAVIDNNKVSPSISKYTKTGLLLGSLVSLVVLIVLAMLDGTIHDEEYLLKTYDYPILAKVPNLLGTSEKKYAYYYQKKKVNKE